MAKNIFATFGILAVLLMSFGMVSAAVENVTLTVVGDGGSAANPISGLNLTEHEVTFTINQSNTTYTNMKVNFSGSAEFLEVPAGVTLAPGINTFKLNITMPDETKTGHRVLTANFYDNADVSIESDTLYIYYDSTKPAAPVIISGCTNSSATNYNTAAEVDDGSCKFSVMCENTGNPADLSIDIKDIDVNEGFGKSDDYWYPLDEIEIEIEIENDGDDVEDIEITFCLYDIEEDDCILDEDDVDLDEDDFDLDNNDKQKVYITFKINPDDLSESNDYEIRVGATGVVDDSDSLFDENESCVEEQEDIEIRTDNEFVILNDIRFEALSGFEQDSYFTGDQVRIVGEVWNIDEEDIDDDKIFLQIYNNALGIDEVIEFDSGVDSLDLEMFEIIITIPANAQERTYKIEFTVYDDEKMASKHIYRNEEDDKAEYIETVSIQVKKLAPSISPTLESKTVEGTELVVKALITNNGEGNDFTIFASGYESWATLVSVTPEIVGIVEGETIEATVILMPIKSGMQSFKISTTVDGETFNQPVSVNIKEAAGFFGLSGTTLYIAGGIAIMLILILVVLIVKVASRKPAKANF